EHFSRYKIPINKIISGIIFFIGTPISGVIQVPAISLMTVTSFVKCIFQLLGYYFFHGSHRVEDVWVVTGIDQTSKKELYRLQLKKMMPKTIFSLIQ
ncbi:hypothetical protein HZS_964, partial [Henneguya salminicola]